ncbi:glycosyltransferase family 2 protein [Halomarina pelagica]|uniref:glycosyltransferase family 2 protein n=1 Tax=Halomarina pelagica TaxID=2961599 RepID=UPI0020C33C70|nr:glycosyltransferase family 2 protein [Halomarina sp. BND7]
MAPLVSYIIATYNRKNDLVECIKSVLEQEYRPREIIIISNSTDGTEGLFEFDGELNKDCIKFHQFNGRMGVAKARNVGYVIAAGDIFVTLDDDAILTDSQATNQIVDLFESYDRIGALAFRSINYYTGKVDTAEFPYRNNDRPFDEPFEATYFVGVGNALKRSAVDEVGLYPDTFEYGFEELDISLRLLDAGYRIRYVPSVTVKHKQSPHGRFPGRKVAQKRLENRIRVGVRHLPWKYVVVSSVLWTAYAFYLSKFDPRPVIRALYEIYASWNILMSDRNVIREDTIQKLVANSGRLYY